MLMNIKHCTCTSKKRQRLVYSSATELESTCIYTHTVNRNLGIFHMTIEDEGLFYHCVVWKNSKDFPLHYVLSHLLIIRVILKRLLILLIKNIIMTKQIYKDTYICVTCTQKNFSMIKIYSTKKIRCVCETQIPNNGKFQRRPRSKVQTY